MNLEKELQDIFLKIDGNRMKNKKVLVIGSTGFIGSYLINYLNHCGIDYLSVDIKEDENSKNHIIENICKRIPTHERYDYVINCAGIASPVFYMKKPIQTLDVSYVGTKNVLDYCLKTKPESIIMFSSSEVYGTPPPNKLPTDEQYIGNIATMSSRSCYDVGKMVLETLCHSYMVEYGCPIKIIRPFNFYGPYMNPNDQRVLSNWIKRLRQNKKMLVYDHGKQTRTFCYIADGICGILKAMLDGKNGQVYNIGNPYPEISMVELAKKLEDCFGKKNSYEVVEYPEDYPKDEPQRRCPDISKAKNHLKYEPIYGFEYGVQKMNEYYDYLEAK